MDINRRQFIGRTIAAGMAATCLPSFGKEIGLSEYEKCRNDILYFVDNYLEVNDRLHGKLKLTDQQREYLKRISTASDYFFCAKGRQIGISTANNVFAYWKSIFFGQDQYVFIVEPSEIMKENAKNMYGDVSNTGAFMPLPNRVHFIKPSTMMANNLFDKNSTFILDEFDFWDNNSLNELSKSHLDRFLMNSLYAKELSPKQFEQFKAHMIVSSSVCSYGNTFATILRNIDNGRKLVLPNERFGIRA